MTNNRIRLSSLNMNHFTVLDTELYCKFLNINSDNITELYLYDNNLTDISGISIFKNLKVLNLNNNKITGISFLKNLVNLEVLSIENLNLTDELKAVNILKNLPKLKTLFCYNTFKTINIGKELKGIDIYD